MLFQFKYCIIFLFLWTSTLVNAQIFERKEGENIDTFIGRIYPNRVVVHQIFQVHEWDTTKNMIVAFYAHSEASDKDDIGAIGYAYVEKEKNKYAEILIDSIHKEGGYLDIETVFFANCDKDKKREMFVLCTSKVQHKDVSGTIYQTFIYDNIDTKKPPIRFTFLDKISKDFDGGFEGINDAGERTLAKYKTVKDIRKELKKRGF
jgi:hypothetical protein